MSSTPKQSVQINNLEHDDEETQDEEHLHVVQSAVSLFQANKIDKRNVWNVALIDVFDALVRNHHAYVSDFRNVGIYLEATTKIYEVRVDSVHHDVRRLCYGAGRSAGNVSNSTNESVANNDKNCDESPIKNGLKKRPRKKRIQNMNIGGPRQINAPLSMVPLSDDLSYRLNQISGDISDSKRLFTTVLPTKNSLLQLFSKEKFINIRVNEPIEFRDDCMYDDYEDISLPIDLMFSEQLPIRQMLSGYRLQNTPMHEDEDDEDEDVDMFFEQNDIEQDYAFDVDASVQPDRAWASNIFADQMNNNLDDASKHDDASRYDEIENEEVISVNNISKGEYSYRVVDHIRNYWAGPSYWKFSLNRLSVQSAKPKLRRAQTRRLKIQPEKAYFIGEHSTDTDSDNEVFIKVNSRAARKIRQVNYTLWLPEKLKLPKKVDLPDDLFGFYKYEPSFEIFGPRNSVETISNESIVDDDDFSDMGFENSPGDGFDDNMIDMEIEPFAADISQNFEDAPQAVENIRIGFDRRAKLVNMKEMIRQTEISIDRQLHSTAANENLDTAEPMQPGKAMLSCVFKDLLNVWKKFLKSKSDLTTALVLFATLHVSNNQRLRLKKHSIGNDFDIFQLKKDEN